MQNQPGFPALSWCRTKRKVNNRYDTFQHSLNQSMKLVHGLATIQLGWFHQSPMRAQKIVTRSGYGYNLEPPDTRLINNG
jgi:hypothetical protein